MLEIILQQPGSGISDILKRLAPGSTAVSTLNRDLKAMVEEQLLIKSGSGRITVYHVAPGYRLVHGNIGDSYFDKDIDERKGLKRLNDEEKELA